MLVLLTPDFSGTEAELAVVAELTGLLPYDLRTRLCRGAYSVVRAIADPSQAGDLVMALRSRGISAVVIDSAVGHDPGRRVVYARGLELLPEGVALRLRERQMMIPYPALLCIVRGEVHLGRTPRAHAINGSGQHRTMASGAAFLGSGKVGAEGSGPREPRAPVPQEVFAAADLHFVTVHWVARIDAREFEFPTSIPPSDSLAERLDWLVDELATRGQIHVDRHLRISSLASHTANAPRTTNAGMAAVTQRSVVSSDEHLDAYSRLVAEAERQRRCPA